MVARGESLLPVFASLCRHVEALCDGSLCSVHTIAADRKRLRIGAAPSLPKALFDIHDGQFIDGRDPCSLAATDAAAIAATDLAGDSRWVGSPWLSITQSLGFGSCFALPIISTSGVVSGVVAIYRSRPVMPALQQREQELIDRFTKIAGIAIDRNQAVLGRQHPHAGTGIHQNSRDGLGLLAVILGNPAGAASRYGLHGEGQQKFADSSGWGYAAFEYDDASDSFRPGD